MSNSSHRVCIILGFFLIGLFGCSEKVTTNAPPTVSKAPLEAKVTQPVDAMLIDAAPPPDPLAHQPDLQPSEAILITVDGQERSVKESVAVAHGYQIIDLSDDWVPMILSERTNEEGNVIPNNYRTVFRGLANDKIDSDGAPLSDEELNFLEVYGIPPSLGIVAGRMLADESKTCLKELDYDLIGHFEFIPVTKYDRRRQRRRLAKRRKAVAAFEKENGKLSLADVQAKDQAIAKMITENSALPNIEKAFLEIEKRMYCDDHVRKRFRHRKGQKDDGFQKAVRRFQRKNKLYVWGLLEEITLEALSKPPQSLHHKTFVRALRERIVAATGVLEDGSTVKDDQPITYLGKDGQRHPVRNLVEEFVEATLQQMNIRTPSTLLEFVRRRGVDGFESLRIGVKLPPLPEYYSKHMPLSIIVDRGSVWYDFPYTDSGRKKRQRRKRYPTLSVMLEYNGETFPLTRWRTTIGGWAEEQAENGYVYLKYKMSDVGKRVIRKIVAAPTWRPPSTTPISTLVKRKWLNGKVQNVVSYDQLGPGYLSAFGLVAGYFVIPGKNGRDDWDKGIRAHGSFNYMSILSKRGYSHGCHRLQNDRAVRLYGFLLSRRSHKVHGEIESPFRRTYLHNEEAYEMYLPSQGFKYILEPPIEVDVLEGSIEGELEEPLEDMMEIPGQEYPVPINFLDSTDAGIGTESPADASLPASEPANVTPKKVP